MKLKSTSLLILSAIILTVTAQAEPQRGKGKRPNPGQMFEKADVDNSGTLSREEVKGRIAEKFDALDTDGNGELTQNEIKAFAQENGRSRGNSGPRGKAKEADSDQNGAISKAEAEAAGMGKLLENFDTLDADGNGEISKEEFQEARNSRKKKGK